MYDYHRMARIMRSDVNTVRRFFTFLSPFFFLLLFLLSLFVYYNILSQTEISLRFQPVCNIVLMTVTVAAVRPVTAHDSSTISGKKSPVHNAPDARFALFTANERTAYRDDFLNFISLKNPTFLLYAPLSLFESPGLHGGACGSVYRAPAPGTTVGPSFRQVFVFARNVR